MSIGKELRRIREERGLTQAELADMIGVSEKVVSKWECGETKPSADILPALADAFGINIDDLFGHRHDIRGDLLASVRDYLFDTEPEAVFDRMQEIVSHMALGAEMRRNRSLGCYKPDILAEIDGELLELIRKDDPRPQILWLDDMELLTNIRNDRLKFAVMQQYPNGMFADILDRFDLYRPVFEFLAMPGADVLLKAAYGGTLPYEVTADYACELTGAPEETVNAFFRLTHAREQTALIKGKEITIQSWRWYTGTNLRAVIAAAYMMSEKWGGHR